MLVVSSPVTAKQTSNETVAPTVSQRCASAELNLQKGNVAEARDVYAAIRLDAPSAACADVLERKLVAARKRAEVHYAAGKHAQAKGDRSSARTHFLDALQRDRSYREAAAALAQLGTPSNDSLANVRDPFAAAKRYAALGLHQDALQALKIALKDTDRRVPEQLEYLSGGAVPLWQKIVRQLEPYGRPLGEMLAVLAVPLILVGGIFYRALRSPRVEIADFNDDSAGVKVAGSVTALLRDRTRQLSENLLPRFGGFIHGPAQTVALPATIAAAVPASIGWLQWIPALVHAASPRRLLTISGTLHPAGENGAGLTLTLREGNRVRHTSTLWQRHFDPSISPTPTDPPDPSDYYDLADPAAVWLLFRLSEVSR
jgi:hypothetical protein